MLLIPIPYKADRIELDPSEPPSRLARAVLVQELAIVALKARDVRVLAANGNDLTETDDEMKNAMRQMAVVFAELEKRRLVKKLRDARERMRATGVKVEGRRSHAELNQDLVREAKRLRRRSPKGHQRSLREISAMLLTMGFVSATLPSSRLDQPSGVADGQRIGRGPWLAVGGSYALTCARSWARSRRTRRWLRSILSVDLSARSWMASLGLEGIVSKRIDSPYRSGPFLGWRKIKCPGYVRP